MKKNVVLKKKFRGLKEGTEFGYDEKLNAWKYEQNDEEIADSMYRNSRVKVQFSDSYVRANPDVFEGADVVSQEELEKKVRIEQLESQMKSLQVELDKLNTNDNGRV